MPHSASRTSLCLPYVPAPLYSASQYGAAVTGMLGMRRWSNDGVYWIPWDVADSYDRDGIYPDTSVQVSTLDAPLEACVQLAAIPDRHAINSVAPIATVDTSPQDGYVSVGGSRQLRLHYRRWQQSPLVRSHCRSGRLNPITGRAPVLLVYALLLYMWSCYIWLPTRHTAIYRSVYCP